VSIPLWRQHLVFGTEARLIGPRRFTMESAAESDTVILLNGHLTWKDLPKGFSATIKIYNLAATSWQEPVPAEDSFPISRFPRTGPTVNLRLSYQY
jgi:hypothetical protein